MISWFEILVGLGLVCVGMGFIGIGFSVGMGMWQ